MRQAGAPARLAGAGAMNPVEKRFRRLEPLLDRALELDAAGRERFLAICADIYPDLIKDLRRALTGDSALPELGGLAHDLTADRPTNRAGLRVGAWRLLEKIGQGGMGTVYLAERADGAFIKQVAIKLLRGGDARFRQQLERERQLLARLEHPGIARLMDGGVLDDGQPWLAMELAGGENLDVWLRRVRPGLERRLAVFIAICDAVSHAHGENLVHRDLKPGNIRVAGDDSVKLLDFGIAKLLSPDSSSANTRHIAVTPEYAAPEQLSGDTISPRTDVYALGALLHLLLTGHSPHPRFDGNWIGYIEAIRTVASTPASTAAVGELALAPASLRGDLDAIVAKALARDPNRRYASAAAFAQDIRHYLAGEAVTARAGTWRYRGGKWTRRNWPVIVLVTFFLLILGATIAGMIWWAATDAGNAARRAGHAQDSVARSAAAARLFHRQ